MSRKTETKEVRNDMLGKRDTHYPNEPCYTHILWKWKVKINILNGGTIQLTNNTFIYSEGKY